MIKVKVKVKTLLLILIGILFIIFVIIPFAYIELANYLNNKYPLISDILYDNYIKYPGGTRKDEAFYKKSQELMANYNKYYIFLGGKLWNSLIDYTTIQEVIENNKRIINEYPKSKYLPCAYKAILDTYIYVGNNEELERWVDWGKEQDKKELRDISILYDGYNHFVNRKYNEAEKILKDFTLGNENLDYIYYYLKGHIAFAMEDFENASYYYEKASEVGWQHKSNFFGSAVPDGRNYWLSTLDLFKGDYKIRGRVTVDGVGIPFVEVYIQHAHMGHSTSDNNFIAITDKNGYFESIGIKEGEYDIGIGIGSPLLFNKVYLDKNLHSITVDGDEEVSFEFTSPMKLISPKAGETVKDNKFIVEWEDVEGADYYTVYSVAFEDPKNMKGFSLTFGLKDEKGEYKIRDKRAVFDLEILNGESTGRVFYPNGEGINPQAIIGYFHKGAEMPIIVSAYDKDGNKLNSSIPQAAYYDNVPSIIIDNRDLTVGEELILSREYEKAIAYYENLLEEDKDNIEALRYLSRMYMFNWDKNKRDIGKSIDYAIKLYEITGKTDLLTEIMVQAEADEQRQHKELIEKMISTVSEEDMDELLLDCIGAYYRYIGELAKARDIMAGNLGNTLVPEIIYIDIYLEEFDTALDRLKEEKVKLPKIDKGKLIEGIEIIKKLDKNKDEYMTFKAYLYRLISRELDYNESYNDFQTLYNNINNKGIKIILDEIRKNNRWY